MDSYARPLFCLRIIHSLPDMGTFAQGLEEAFVRHLGRRRWDEYQALADRFWRAARAALAELALNYTLVDLYQDGLPICGQEMDIVRQAAQQGSENFRLLQDLIAQGATLMGTEDPRLLLEERTRLIKALPGTGDSSAAGPPIPARPAGEGQDLLSRRDAFIARLIDRTLQPGRTGILFLGMAHQIQRFLPKDIVVSEIRLDV